MKLYDLHASVSHTLTRLTRAASTKKSVTGNARQTKRQTRLLNRGRKKNSALKKCSCRSLPGFKVPRRAIKTEKLKTKGLFKRTIAGFHMTSLNFKLQKY